MNQFVDITSTRVAKTFGLFPQKGTVTVGADADLVIFDPTVERTISVETSHMAADYNPFEGMEVTGQPVSVLSRGEFVIRDKEFVGKLGSGKYLKRSRYGNFKLSSEEQLTIK